MASDCEQLFKLKTPFSADDLKKSYRDLAKQHHPDKFQDPEEKNQAHEKFTQINLCLDQLRKLTGGHIPGSGAVKSAGMRGKGWTTFEQYISYLKSDPNKSVVWDQFITGESSKHQSPIQPLSEELKQHVPFELYTHQAEALDHYRKGENLVLVTPTASGKSMGYMLPFFEQYLSDPNSTSIFIFPMKALANDQYANFDRLTNGKISQAVFDGDTDKDSKATIKNNPPTVLYTNPDELHHSILYTASEWNHFFKNLKLIVLDEIHIYKGSFGSNVSNVIARLLHIVKAAGANPQLVCTSATIKNPLPFAEKLTGKKFHLIDRSGAGQAEKYLVMVEPRLDEGRVPLITPPSIALQESINFALNDHQVIVFVSSRSEADILANQAKMIIKELQGPQPVNEKNSGNLPAKMTPDQIVSAYHAGYSRDVRRGIEERIKSGHIKIIFSTSALELGVDIGSLDTCILLGIPPTNNEIWQRIGRAGRKAGNPAFILLINNFSAFDWYHFANPQHFLSGRNNPDRPIIDPMNPEIRKQHLNCGYFEGMRAKDVKDKANWRAINKKENKWWAYHRIQIRGGNPNPYTLEDETGQKIGEIEYDRAYRDLYPGALYEIDGNPFLYISRDYKKRVFKLKALHQADEFTTPFAEIDAQIQEESVVETILKFESLSLLIGYGQMDLDKVVSAYNLRYKSNPEMKQFRPIKYPDKWPTEKVAGFWLAPLPGEEKEWEKVIRDHTEVSPYSIFIILHTIEHLLIRAIREMGYCDWSDLAGASSASNPFTNTPATLIYETQQKGIGLTKAINDNIEVLLQTSLMRLERCPCVDGCPACVLTPPFCQERQGLLDKNLAKMFLTALLKSMPSRSSFSRANNSLRESLSVERGTFQVGDLFQEGWYVHKVTDDGIIVQNKTGDLKVIPFEDTPL